MQRLIVDRDCGFDEGVTVWRDVLSNVLSEKLDIKELNFHGTSFTYDWWHETLGTLNENLKNI